MQNKVIVIAGATATGKTAMAEKIALEQGGQLINADSRQNYKYLDIGTNKGFLEQTLEADAADLPVFKTQSGVNIHQVSFLDLDQSYSAAQFQTNTAIILKQLLEAGKSPIIVGGTGLYIQSIIEANRYNFTDSQDNQEFHGLNLQQLQNLLQKNYLNEWNDLKNDRKQNAVHLRGLLRQLKRQGVEVTNNPTINFLNSLDFKLIYTQTEQEKHKKVLESRVKEMWKAGFVDEVQKVLALGFSKETPALKTIGYPEIIQYLEGEISEEEACKQIFNAHWQYARKQIKWFKKYFLPMVGV